jgi:hypothetical protein
MVILIPRKSKEVEERKMLYFDLTCGIVSSIIALSGIISFAILYGITYWPGFFTGLIFWAFYLVLSIFMIGIGLYTKKKERELFGEQP